MGKYIAESRYIASIWPGQMEGIQMHHGPSMNPKDGTSTWYRLKPFKKERGSKLAYVIEVNDSFEHAKNELKSADQGHKVTDLNPVYADEIVQSLIKYWTGNYVGIPHEAKPGIMEIANSVPTQAELAQMQSQQNAFMEYWYLEGQRIAIDPSIGMKGIPPMSKLAAEYLGRKTNWSHPAESLTMVNCPACKTAIPEDSYVCSGCGTKLKALPPELAQLNEAVA